MQYSQFVKQQMADLKAKSSTMTATEKKNRPLAVFVFLLSMGINKIAKIAKKIY